MVLYIPPEGDRVQVALAETSRRREARRIERAILAARRKAGLRQRHEAKSRRKQ